MTLAIAIAIAVLVWPTALLLGHPELLRTTMYVLMALLVAYFVVSGVRRGDCVQAQRYLALFALFIALVVFWALSLQGVTSLNFLARDYVDAPWDFTVFQSVNPLFILVMAPFLALLWPWLEKRRRDPSTPVKFAIALVLVAASYGVLVYAIHHFTGADGHLAWWPLALCYLLQTLGELALSPIGYALVGQLAAPEEASLAMGGWFFGVAIAYQVAGWIATLTANAATVGGITDYAHVYARVALWGLALAVAFALTTPLVRRWMHGVH